MAQNLVEYVLDIKTKAAEQGLDSVVDGLEEIEKELKNTQNETEETSSKFEKFKKAGMAIGKVGAVVGAVAVALSAVGAAAFSLAQKMADLTNELNDLSVRSGLATDTISGLRFALIASGQPAEGLNEILGAISGQFAQLATEGSAVEKKFADFGIAVRDTNGELRTNNDIMLDGIRLIQNIGDSSERSRVAVTLFGEAGSKLNQALAAGDFEKFLKFTEKFGVKTGPEASKSAANFQVAISAMTLSFDGMLQKFTQSTGLIDKVTDQLINIGSVFAFVGSLIESFSKEIGTMAEAFERDFKVIMDILGVFVDLISETVDALTPMGGAFEKAFADAEEFRAGMEDFKKTLVAVSSVSGETEKAIDEIGAASNNTQEKIRSLNDVLRDVLGIRFDGSNLLKDFQIVLSSLESGFITFTKGAGNAFVGLGDILIKSAEKGSRGFFNVMNSVLIKLQSLFDGISIKIFEGFSKAEGSKVVNALSNFITTNPAFTSILGVFKIAQGLGGRARSTEEIREMQRRRREEGKAVAMSVAEVRQRDIEKSIEEDIRARAKAIELGLRALPRILFNVLPPLFVEFADRVVFGFFKSIAEFVGILKDFFRSIFTREGRQERKQARDRRQEARGEEFRRRLEQLVNIAGFRSGGRFLPSAKGGIKFTGADEGLAMLHRGEFVVPETGQMPQAVQRTMGMGQGGMTININAAVVESNAIDELVRQIERRFQTFGSSTSPLFGGR